jgi:integrase
VAAIKQRVARSSAATKLSGLIAVYIAELQSEGHEKNGIAQAKTCLGRFARMFGGISPADIDAEEIETWFNSLPYATRTIWNHYSQARQFYNWREIRRIVPVTPFLDVEAPPKTDSDARKMILTPSQMRGLLGLELEPWIKAKIVLGGFAGLRTCELARMSYDCIDEEFSEINVRKEEAKGGKAMRPRSITLQDAVLRHLPKGKGPLIAESKEWKCHRGMPAEAKLGLDRFPQNALRHSFASYHLAHFRDASKTAFELGHTSPRLTYECYANAVSRRDAAEWWSL